MANQWDGVITLGSNGFAANAMPKLTWAELQATYPPSVALAGLHVWCTNYPSVSGNGAEVVCTGTRWRSISQQHCLLSPPSVPDGLLFAAGSAAALYGDTVFIPGGVLRPGDNVRLMLISQHPTIGAVSRNIALRVATTQGGVVAGSVITQFSHASGTNNNIGIDKFCTFLDETKARTTAGSQASSGVAGTTAQVTFTLPSIANGLHMGLVVTPSSDTSWLMFAASIYVEFAR